MKIKEIHLTNFSSHAQSDVFFSKPIALVVGQLNAGKSSILQAIEYALTGDCGYHRKRTDSRSELVRGAGAFGGMEVRILTDVGQAVRARNGVDNVEAMEWDGVTQSTIGNMAAVVTAATRVKEDVLSSILNTSGFFNLEEARQKEIIIGLIGAEVTDAKVRAAWTGEADALKCLPAGTINSIASIEKAYDYVFKRRTVAKRELEELKPPVQPEGPRPNLDGIRARLAGIRKELETAVSDKAKLEGAAAAVSGKQRLQEKVSELEAVLARPVPRPDEFIKGMHDQETIFAEAAASAQALESEMIDLRVILATCQTNIDLLTTFNGKCVAGDHLCPAPVADMKAALLQQKEKLAFNEESVAEIQKRWEAVCQVRDDRTQYQELKRKYDEVAAIVEGRSRIGQELGSLQTALKKPDSTIDKDAIATMEAAITVLRGRVAKGEELITAANSWLTRDEQITLVAASRKRLETEVRYLEELCKFLGPKEGIRVQLIDEKINTFIGEIQKYVQPFGFTLALTVDPWMIVINEQPVKRLSSSERYRLSVAFQVAIAKMSGVNFVVCDGSEILTPPVFSAMMGMLAGSGLDQVIVIKTLMIPTPQFLESRPKNASLECFVVTNTDGISVVEQLD